MDKRQRRQ